MTRRAPPAPADDAQLFREAVADAKPIRRRTARVEPERPKLPPVPVQSLIDEREALAELRDARLTPELALETGEEARYVRDGLSPRVLKRLRRGEWIVQDELDLHGATREVARELLAEFLRDARRRGLRCLRVIHGKGLGSANREPVLKGKVIHWLAQRDEVIAFCQAPPLQGGGGALLVLLRG
jgi:DNA-nicking Smr family endonuclease